MTKFGAVAYLAAIFVALPAHAQHATGEAELRRHIAYLASDALEGRRPGTEGETLSAQYIARNFAELGLEPGYGDSYISPVELIDRRAGSASLSWSRHGEAREIRAGEVTGFGRGESESFADLPVIFLGYGRDLDNAEALPMEIAGAAVLLLADRPGVTQGVDELDTRFRQIAEQGAAAIIGITQDVPSWEVAKETAQRGHTSFAAERMAPVELMLSPDAAARLLEAAGYDFARLAEYASTSDFEPARLEMRLSGEVSTGVYPLTGHNVLAKLPGSGESGEAVLFLAHHDHLGMCRPESARDRICNGAVDNASGVAELIEIAGGLVDGGRPERDIYFLATTAEELGLLGAQAFANKPPVPLASIVAAINLDTVATSPAGSPVTVVGRGMTPLDPVIDTVGHLLGRRIYDGEEMNAFVERQDGKILLDAGVPSVLVGGINAVAFQRFIVGPYHTPGDELTEQTDLSGAAEDVIFHVALGRALGDTERYRPPPR